MLMKQAMRIHPKPQPGESIEGYALRLACRNGWPTVQAMLKDMGHKKILKLNLIDERFIDVLESLTGHPKQVFLDNFSVSSVFYPYLEDKERCFTKIKQHTPSVCIECLKVEPFIKLDWLITGFDYCLTHNKSLISRCQNCNEQLSWDGSVFKCMCPVCGVRLMPGKDSGSHLVFNKFLKHPESQRAGFLKDLYLASQRILRPYDSIIETAKYPYDYDDWSSVMRAAYQLLTDKTSAKRWMQSCLITRQGVSRLGTAATLMPITVLKEKLTLDWPINEVNATVAPLVVPSNIIEEKHITLIKKGRMEHTNDSQRWKFHADAAQVIEIFGINEFSTLTRLVERRVIPPIKELRTLRDSLFALDELEAMFIPCSLSSAKTLPYELYHHLLKHFGVSLTDWLQWLKIGSLKYRLSNNHHNFMESVEPEITSLQYHLLLTLRYIKNRALPAKRLRAILKITQTDFQHLVSTNVLPLFRKLGEAHISGKHFLSLLNQYIYIPWIAACGHISPGQLQHALMELGCRAVLGQNIYKLDSDSYGALKTLLADNSVLTTRHGELLWLNARSRLALKSATHLSATVQNKEKESEQ